MHLHHPSLILIADTALSATDAALAASGKRSASTSLLVQYIREEFPAVLIEPVARKYWNEQAGMSSRPYSGRPVVWAHICMPKGLEYINLLCVQEDERPATLLATSNK